MRKKKRIKELERKVAEQRAEILALRGQLAGLSAQTVRIRQPWEPRVFTGTPPVRWPGSDCTARM